MTSEPSDEHCPGVPYEPSHGVSNFISLPEDAFPGVAFDSGSREKFHLDLLPGQASYHSVPYEPSDGTSGLGVNEDRNHRDYSLGILLDSIHGVPYESSSYPRVKNRASSVQSLCEGSFHGIPYEPSTVTSPSESDLSSRMALASFQEVPFEPSRR
eukprot:CAMPEP_0113606632 /NCGR_PEP_ID=MMETSP0017_2-20120614/2960_1 /TAXON_ID=2856 /ORGANISM="Cylindrotheca closterium" /LENGTH=155 /DNA_ID=CAMNT_0000515193 /DNA_START=18 /DNA_END=485 /DNA_ORIENTATION=+ /assembly_acc=CAM_ASM_000147